MDDSTTSYLRFAWSEARAGEVATLVLRAYDLPSRHLFKAIVSWDGKWACTRVPQALRSGGRRVDDGLAAAFEAEAERLFSLDPETFRARWLERLERSRANGLAAERKLRVREASLARRRRELLDDAIRFEWETRRAFGRLDFPIERTAICKIQGENRRVSCLIDPRAATLSIKGESLEVEVRLDGSIRASGLDGAAARRLVRSRARRAFEGYGYFFSAIDLEWAIADVDRQSLTLRNEIEALGGDVLEGLDLLARARPVTFAQSTRAPGGGVAWSEVTPLDSGRVRVVAHDLDRALEVSGIASLEDGGWVASVMDLRPFGGDGSPVRTEDGSIADLLTDLAERFAESDPDALEFAGQRVAQRADLVRRMEERRADARMRELRSMEQDAISRATEILKGILDQRSKTEFPASWFYVGSHVELRVTATGDEPLAHVVVESPVEFAWEGGKASLRPGFSFNLEGEIESENPDFVTLENAGTGWALWASQMRRDAIAAVSALIVRSQVGREIEAVMLVQTAKELRRERERAREGAGLAESDEAA